MDCPCKARLLFQLAWIQQLWTLTRRLYYSWLVGRRHQWTLLCKDLGPKNQRKCEGMTVRTFLKYWLIYHIFSTPKILIRLSCSTHFGEQEISHKLDLPRSSFRGIIYEVLMRGNSSIHWTTGQLCFSHDYPPTHPLAKFTPKACHVWAKMTVVPELVKLPFAWRAKYKGILERRRSFHREGRVDEVLH